MTTELPTYEQLTRSALAAVRTAQDLTNASHGATDPAGALARAGLHVEISRVYAQLAATAQLAPAATPDDDQEDDDTPRGGPLPPF
ncbi:hypothetical protein [Streptomyces sp. NPDC094049]|uniref:hypothetical protein n=1 Tax=Streptomyces sp. NPDC094049 TaxID=3154987 RepID=UPI00331A6EC6